MLLLRLHDFEQTESITIRGTIRDKYVCRQCGMLEEGYGWPSGKRLNKYIAKYFEPCTSELTEVEND